MSRVADSKRTTETKNNCTNLLDISRCQPHTLIPMEQQEVKPGRTKQPVAYPLRFRSKAQKKRLEDAAKRNHKTLKDFLLDLGEQAAAEPDGEARAS